MTELSESALLDSDRETIARALTPPGDRAHLGVQEAARRLKAEHTLAVVGALGAAPALLAHALCALGEPRVVYLAADAEAAQRAAADLTALASGLPLAGALGQGTAGAQPLLVLAPENSPYAEVHVDRRAAHGRAAALFHVASGLPWRVLVTSAAGLVRRTAPARVMAGAGLSIEAESELDVTAAAKALTAAGYLRAPVVEDPASFAVRGGILDVWPAGAELPVRIELYGDLVITLRQFNPDDQRTLQTLERLVVPPARESIVDAKSEGRARQVLRDLCDQSDYPSTKARSLIEDVALGRAFFGADGYLPAFYELVSLLDYVSPETPIVIDDPAAVTKALESELERAYAGAASRQGSPHFPVSALYLERDELGAAIGKRPLLLAHRSGVAGGGGDGALARLEHAPVDAPALAISDHDDLARAVKLVRSSRGRQHTLEPLLDRIATWQDHGLGVTLCARSETQADRLATLLGHRGLKIARGSDDAPASARIVVAPLARGAVAPLEGFVLVTEEEIFGPRAHRPKTPKKRSARAMLEDLRALDPGDFIVHAEHGIGRYLGLERKMVGSVGVDLLVVEYAGGDKLFLPVYRLNQIQKYSGGDSAPKLDRLGGQTFARTKAKVEKRVRQMADELLKLYAERNNVTKQPLETSDDDYAAFEASFPFEETRDQSAAISEVMKELESERVMDRLVCGDVGFGKTEVALRAAFRNAVSGRQVALLCPTTVLAQQHFQTFSSRFQDWPITVRAMSRFQSKSEQTETLKGLKEGKVDVVVGTHRLLSKDVHYKNLGLLVVDEEQRFGVTHKERIKQIKGTVDVLTLSATPIPRTLQLAVGGLRDMSIITTPPVDRRAVRTITSQWDPEIVRQAIEREIERGGQVFYVYNRVEGIYERAERLKALLPNARIAVGHGQMTETALEQTMYDFVQGEYDVLCATAIIESGLDIPRANTILIDRADLFGLAQLYQLRGRVGRASERAYCYLLVPPPSQMTDEARARIEALERYSDLGSGFHIATLDMELRGGGDLLGGEQSGFVESVGFDLFCQMLEQATHELRGEPVVHAVDPELSFDVEALLPDSYMAEVGVRLSLYKRLASAGDEAEVDELAAEMEDRFGPPPAEAKRLVELMRLKVELRRLLVLGCEATAKSVTLHLRDDTPLDPQKIGELLARKKSPYRITPDGRLTRRALEGEPSENGLELASRMLSELQSCVKDG
ncbi:MAG TPA: transcription-repair coupling factor [Polyangiaceae bacterium]|nr:transcription-repair coupling factor [Polyangiaceae bacterium]